MPVDVPDPGGAAIGPDDLIEAVEASGVDVGCDAELVTLAPILAALGRNRHFLGERIIAELRDHGRAQQKANPYNAQVIMLHRADRWFVRANIWPAARDPAMRVNGPAPFYYHVPHDHDFSFVTVGYFGPGYGSDYYEVDDRDLIGLPGEKARLRPVGRSALHEGRLLLYRAHIDVHSQLPPASMSVSLNIVGPSQRDPAGNQYRYDVETGQVVSILNASPIEPLIALATRIGGAEGMDLADRFARHHPSDRVRMAAVDALAGAARGVDARIERLEGFARSGSPFVSGMARMRIAGLQSSRDWIERRDTI